MARGGIPKMLERINTVPILAFAVDNMPKFYQEAVDAISNFFPDVKESEILAGAERLNQFLLSDVSEKQNRIFIPITDKLLPIHYVSGASSGGKNMTYVDDVPTATTNGQSVTLRFEIQNSLSKLSAISDILYAITNRIGVQNTNDARVSFFGGSICIYNGYLKGINRSTVTSTNKEVVSLTIEIAQDDTAPDEIAEVPGETPKELLKSVEEFTPESVGILVDEINYTQLTAEQIPEGFLYYQAITLEQLANANLATIYSVNNILRREYRVFNIESLDVAGVRVMTTIEYNRIYLALESDEAIVYVGDYVMIRFNDAIYLGLPDDS